MTASSSFVVQKVNLQRLDFLPTMICPSAPLPQDATNGSAVDQATS